MGWLGRKRSLGREEPATSFLGLLFIEQTSINVEFRFDEYSRSMTSDNEDAGVAITTRSTG
jgi:hypothetical protein